MWARRCGAPYMGPSRCKVMFHSLFSLALGTTIYRFMNSADLGYLDLSRPRFEDVWCLTRWPLQEPATTNRVEHWRDWKAYAKDRKTFIENNQCLADLGTDHTCLTVDVPLRDMQRALGAPLEESIQASSNILQLYAGMFLALGIWLWLAVLVHDLTLLSGAKRDYILDLGGANENFQCLRYAMLVLSGYSFVQYLTQRRSERWRWGLILSVALAPAIVAWALLAFLFLMCPLIMLVFIRHPRRLSRILIFVLCNAFGIYGVILSVHTLIFLAGGGQSPSFAVTWWEAAAAIGSTPCVCGCVYPVSGYALFRLTLVGVGVSITAFSVAFRCLKGLRRSNWASLMTVTFPVPLNAYAVEWTRPDGKPIQHRNEGDPVQGELAFDPFALMDEQPDSAHTVLNLRPVVVSSLSEEGGVGGRRIEGPQWDKPRDFEYVGPCGFPCGAIKAVLARLKTTFSLAPSMSSPTVPPTPTTTRTAAP